MKLKENIDQLNSDIQNIKSSITDKGVEIPDGTPLSEYGDKVTEVYKVGRDSVIDESKIIEKSVSGEYISVDDVSEIPHDVKVQLTSGGKNLWKHGDLTFTENSGGKKVKLLSGITYTFSALVTSTDVERTTCLVYDTTNAVFLGQINRDVRSSITFTPTKQVNEIRLYASDRQATSVGDTATFKDIMLEEKENLLNQSDIKTGTESGITLEYLEDEDCFLLNGTAESTTNRFVTYMYKEGVQNANYTLSTNYISGTIEAEGLNALAYLAESETNTDGSENWLNTGLGNNNNSNTKKLNKKYISALWLYFNTGVTFDNYKFKVRLSDDVASPYEPYKETLTDYSGVSLTRWGGNLFDCLNAPKVDSTYGNDNAIIADRTENSITIQKSADSGWEFAQFALPENLIGEKITVYAEWTDTSAQGGYIRVNWDSKLEAANIIAQSTKSGISGSGVVTEKPSNATYLVLLLYAGYGDNGAVGDKVYYKNVMVNIGDKTIKFEPYNGQTLTANADGTVEGVKSTSPYMYMTTDNPNVTINATYHKSYGMQTEYDRFWDNFQDYGNRQNYSYGFAGYGWTNDTFKPKYSLSDAIINDHLYMFNNSRISEIDYDLNVSYNPSVSYLFAGNINLKKVKSVMLHASATGGDSCFRGTIALEDVTFKNAIPCAFDFHWSTKLSKATILNIFEHLSSTVTGQTLTLSKTAVTNAFGSTTATEWTNLVATKTNWTISLV